MLSPQNAPTYVGGTIRQKFLTPRDRMQLFRWPRYRAPACGHSYWSSSEMNSLSPILTVLSLCAFALPAFGGPLLTCGGGGSQSAGIEFHSCDDRGQPVSSTIEVAGEPVGTSDNDGRFVFANPADCPRGKRVTAMPIRDLASYLTPSTEGLCQISRSPTRLVLRRANLLDNVARQFVVALAGEEWATAALAGNEILALSQQHDISLSPGLDVAIYAATAQHLGIPAESALTFDPRQGRTVMSPKFGQVLIGTRVTIGLSAEPLLDGEVLQAMSAQNSSLLLYRRPEGDLQSILRRAESTSVDSAYLTSGLDSVREMMEVQATGWLQER